MHEPNPTQTSGAFCARHLGQRAVTICNRCGSYACEACLRVGPDRQDYCSDCVQTEPALASLGSRFLANLADQFVVTLPFFIGLMLAALTGSGSRGMERFFATVLVGFGFSLVVILYQLYLVSTGRPSIGKRWLGIRVVRADGSPVDALRMVFLRNGVWLAFNAITGISSLVDALFIFGEKRRCLHDYLADTQVIQVDRRTE